MNTDTSPAGWVDHRIVFRHRDSAALLGSLARPALFPGEIQETREVLAEELGLELAQVRISLEFTPLA